MSSSEKFNKRGFYKNEDLSLNGNEIISDYDGNLMLKYSTKVDVPNDLGGSFTLTYNSNVEHKIFFADDPTPGYSVNGPEWILGFKGFALQALNFENHFKIAHESISILNQPES